MIGFKAGLRAGFERLSDRSSGGLVGQVLVVTSQDVIVPAGAMFVFAEVQAKGGSALRGTGNRRSAGGAGNDAVLAVQPADVVAVSLGYASDAAEQSTITCRGGAIAANSPGASQAGTQTGVSGKYPGTDAQNGNAGKGTGRLAGNVGNTTPGYGGGVFTSFDGEYLKGGRPVACLTFFEAYDDAVAFAKFVYGGAWAP